MDGIGGEGKVTFYYGGGVPPHPDENEVYSALQALNESFK